MSEDNSDTYSDRDDTVEDFIKQSSEIQEEIRKLSNLCEKVSQPKTSRLRTTSEISEKSYWRDLNSLLISTGFEGINVKEPKLSEISDTLTKVLSEYSLLKDKLKRTQETPVYPTKPVLRRNPLDIEFKLRILEEVKVLLDAKDLNSIVPDLLKVKEVMAKLPSIEKFIDTVCNELIPNTYTPDYLDQVVGRLKNLCKLQNEFEFLLQDNMKMKKCTDYYCKLFNVSGIENMEESIEMVFYFVHEMKEFLEIARKYLKLAPKSLPNVVIKEVLRALN